MKEENEKEVVDLYYIPYSKPILIPLNHEDLAVGSCRNGSGDIFVCDTGNGAAQCGTGASATVCSSGTGG